MRKLFAVLLLAPLAACGPKGMSEYNSGVTDLQIGSLERAKEHFEAAVEKNPDFSEAYVNLSVAKYRLSCRLVKDGKKGARLFREAVADRRRAKELMDEGKFFVIEKGEREKVKADTERAIASLAKVEKLCPKDEDLDNALKMLPDERFNAFR